MVEINPDMSNNICLGGIRYTILSAEEVRKLPEETPVEVAHLSGGRPDAAPEPYVCGLRYKRPVLYRRPLRQSYKNIGTFADRMYLMKQKDA